MKTILFIIALGILSYFSVKNDWLPTWKNEIILTDYEIIRQYEIDKSIKNLDIKHNNLKQK